MLEFAAPIISEKHPTTQYLWQDCPKHQEDQIREERNTPNPYEALYVKELSELLKQSKMVGIYHFNAINSRANRKAWQNARRLKMDLKTYEPVMVKGALKDSPWENLTFFLGGTFARDGLRLVFSPSVNADALFQFEKKVTEAFLMAAVVENRILDRRELEQLSKMPPLESLLAETLAILNSPTQKTLQLLNSNQQKLSTNLSQYIKDKTS